MLLTSFYCFTKESVMFLDLRPFYWGNEGTKKSPVVSKQFIIQICCFILSNRMRWWFEQNRSFWFITFHEGFKAAGEEM